MIKKKEFQWNKLPKKDYFYNASNRLGLVVHNFLNSSHANFFYPCLKENGDINCVIEKFPKKILTKYPIYYMSITWGKTAEALSAVISGDLIYGNLGYYCYFWVEDINGYFRTYVIPLKDFKNKSKVIKRLRDYRVGKFKTEANSNFDKNFEVIESLNPKIIIGPKSKKKMRFFKNG